VDFVRRQKIRGCKMVAKRRAENSGTFYASALIGKFARLEKVDWGHKLPSANHLLTYEKEFATVENRFIPKSWLPGHHGDLLPE
jgi:hypothetical protein